ncbi:MAG: efflux RND transporter periplasmic adaptor subunit [Phycisphaerae bacterium]|nr:efflux RND transporter periplasmic adaptor subunit [Phycisphaerae bacterium]
MSRRVLWLALTATLLALPGCPRKSEADAKKGGPGAGGPRAVPITVATVQTRAIPLEIRTFGTAETSRTVAIRAQVSDILSEVRVEKGQQVNAGDVLFRIQPESFVIALRQAQAALARNMVLVENAQADYRREKALADKGISSSEALEKVEATAKALAATTQADRATIEGAQLQLDRCTIRSPIRGRIGDILVHQGNLVRANDQTLAVINQIQPIEVFFSVPQQDLPAVRRQMGLGPLELRAEIPDCGTAEIGRLTFIDNTVDKGSGTIRLGAVFANESQQLWPGLFVHIVLRLSVDENAMVAPVRAVQTGRDAVSGKATKYVFVVVDGPKAKRQFVTLNRTYHDPVTDEDWAVITDGLTRGATVVTQGQFQLTDGSTVQIRGDRKATTQSAAPPVDDTPRPATRPGKREGGRP